MAGTENTKASELLHTPGGVRDIYGSACARKLEVQHSLEQVMHSYGFRNVQTPTFEYFDIFNKERGTAASNEMFKFFDRGNNTLVLRPDMTPAIARAELFMDDSSDADAEMLALTIECLLESGLKEFQIEVGHADLFRALVEEAGFEEETIETLRNLIESKNFFGVEELLGKLTVQQGLKEVFVKLPELLENLKEAADFVRARSKSERVYKALERLEKLEEILKIYGLEDYVTIDLSMLSHYSYYTGVVFRAYTYGNGEAIASGGRYDGLVAQFGKEAPAIGLVIVLDQLMIAMERQKLFGETALGGTLLVYPKEVRAQALQEAKKMREGGQVVQMMRKSSKKEIEEYVAYAKRNGNDSLIYLTKDGEKQQMIEAK